MSTKKVGKSKGTKKTAKVEATKPVIVAYTAVIETTMHVHDMDKRASTEAELKTLIEELLNHSLTDSVFQSTQRTTGKRLRMACEGLKLTITPTTAEVPPATLNALTVAEPGGNDNPVDAMMRALGLKPG